MMNMDWQTPKEVATLNDLRMIIEEAAEAAAKNRFTVRINCHFKETCGSRDTDLKVDMEFQPEPLPTTQEK